MGSLCDSLIKKDISPNCDDPITPGYEAEGVIINRRDIDFAASVFDETNKNVIKTLVLKKSKKAYRIVVPGKTPFTGTKTALAVGTYNNTFTNDLSFVVLDDGPDVCSEIIDGITNGEFVVILERKYKGLQNAEHKGNKAFKVYGWYQGLMANTMENDSYSEETDGGWAVALQETKSPKSALFLFNTDYDTTKAQVETLVSTPAA
jgi:hypothetical protein